VATESQQWQEEAVERAAMFGGLFKRLRDGDTFFFLFLLLLVNFAVAVTANESLPGRIVAGVLSGAAPLVAFLAAKAPRRWVFVAAGAFVATFFLSGFGEWIDNPLAVSAVNTLHLILLFWSVPIVLRRLFAHEQVTFETVAGSLCVYLLIGLAFANLYMAMSAGGSDPVISATFQKDLPVNRGDFYYFSFIGMLTVGFGDFVPITQAAKALTALQAILGQVVLLTLVARMVSTAKPGRRWIKRMEKHAREEARVDDRDDDVHGEHATATGRDPKAGEKREGKG